MAYIAQISINILSCTLKCLRTWKPMLLWSEYILSWLSTQYCYISFSFLINVISIILFKIYWRVTKFHNLLWVFLLQVAYLLEVWPSWLMQLTCYQTLLHFLSVFLPSGSLAGCQIRKGHLVTTEQVIHLALLHAHVW